LFSPISSTNKTDHHDKIEILLKVVLNTITSTINCHFNTVASLLKLKSGLIIEVASLEEDNLLVFYYLSASEIWPDKLCGLCVKGLLEGDYCTHIKSHRK
jgi:hypothetical protein